MADEINTCGSDDEPCEDDQLGVVPDCCAVHPERHRTTHPPAWMCGVPAHRVTVEFSPDGEVHAVTLRRVGRGPAISQQTLKEFSLAKAVAAVAEFQAALAEDPVLGAMFPAAQAEYVRGLLQRRSGRRPKPAETYLIVAEQFVGLVADGERAPIRRLAEYYGRPHSTVNNWIARAREEEILSSPGHGRVGAEFTAYGRKLLDERTPSQPTAPWLARPQTRPEEPT